MWSLVIKSIFVSKWAWLFSDSFFVFHILLSLSHMALSERISTGFGIMWHGSDHRAFDNIQKPKCLHTMWFQALRAFRRAGSRQQVMPPAALFLAFLRCSCLLLVRFRLPSGLRVRTGWEGGPQTNKKNYSIFTNVLRFILDEFRSNFGVSSGMQFSAQIYKTVVPRQYVEMFPK